MLILIFFILCFFGCRVQNSEFDIYKTYTYKGDNREISINFIDNQYLVIRNTFQCSNIDTIYREYSMKKKYTLAKKKIIISNFSKKDSIVLPYFESSNCFFLTKEYRTGIKKRIDGATFYPDRSLYTIPNIDYLIIYNNDLIYYKEDKLGSIGFIFKSR
ncbi:hypothetical protein ACTS9U_10775 [Empedobacter falsenii]